MTVQPYDPAQAEAQRTAWRAATGFVLVVTAVLSDAQADPRWAALLIMIAVSPEVLGTMLVMVALAR